MVITESYYISKSKDQPGKVANPARGQLNKENEFFPVPVHSRDGFGSPVPRQPAHLHTQAESDAYFRETHYWYEVGMLKAQFDRNRLGTSDLRLLTIIAVLIFFSQSFPSPGYPCISLFWKLFRKCNRFSFPCFDPPLATIYSTALSVYRTRYLVLIIIYGRYMSTVLYQLVQ